MADPMTLKFKLFFSWLFLKHSLEKDTKIKVASWISKKKVKRTFGLQYFEYCKKLYIGLSGCLFFFFYQSLHLSLQHTCPERLQPYLEEQPVLCLSTGPSVWLLVTWFRAWWWSPQQNCQNHSPCEARLCEVLISSDFFVVSPFFRNKATSRKRVRWTAVQSRNVQSPVLAIWSNSQLTHFGNDLLDQFVWSVDVVVWVLLDFFFRLPQAVLFDEVIVHCFCAFLSWGSGRRSKLQPAGRSFWNWDEAMDWVTPNDT